MASLGLRDLFRRRRGPLAFLAVVGPGLIAGVAGNDAGGITTYAPWVNDVQGSFGTSQMLPPGSTGTATYTFPNLAAYLATCSTPARPMPRCPSGLMSVPS